MTIQNTYEMDPEIGVPGMLADLGPSNIITVASAVRQLVQVDITADDSQDFTLTINGTDFTYSSDGTATATEIRDGLIALVNAGSEPVTAEALDADSLLLESDDYGDGNGFTLSTSAGGSGDLSTTTLADQAEKARFGCFICQDDRGDDDQGRLPRTAADVTGPRGLGVALQDPAREANAEEYRTETAIPVALRGRVLVRVEDAVSAGSKAFVRYASGSGGSKLGAWRSDADSSSAAEHPTAVFRTSASAGGLATLEING